MLNQVYANQSKVNGINLNDPTVKQQIYEQYLKAYKKGVFNYIKEDVNNAGQSMPRKYFSGGILEAGAAANPAMTTDPAMLYESVQGANLVDFATLASTLSDKAMIGQNDRMAVLDAVRNGLNVQNNLTEGDLRSMGFGKLGKNVFRDSWVDRNEIRFLMRYPSQVVWSNGKNARGIINSYEAIQDVSRANIVKLQKISFPGNADREPIFLLFASSQSDAAMTGKIALPRSKILGIIAALMSGDGWEKVNLSSSQKLTDFYPSTVHGQVQPLNSPEDYILLMPRRSENNNEAFFVDKRNGYLGVLDGIKYGDDGFEIIKLIEGPTNSKGIRRFFIHDRETKNTELLYFNDSGKLVSWGDIDAEGHLYHEKSDTALPSKGRLIEIKIKPDQEDYLKSIRDAFKKGISFDRVLGVKELDSINFETNKKESGIWKDVKSIKVKIDNLLNDKSKPKIFLINGEVSSIRLEEAENYVTGESRLHRISFPDEPGWEDIYVLKSDKAMSSKEDLQSVLNALKEGLFDPREQITEENLKSMGLGEKLHHDLFRTYTDNLDTPINFNTILEGAFKVILTHGKGDGEVVDLDTAKKRLGSPEKHSILQVVSFKNKPSIYLLYIDAAMAGNEQERIKLFNKVLGVTSVLVIAGSYIYGAEVLRELNKYTDSSFWHLFFAVAAASVGFYGVAKSSDRYIKEKDLQEKAQNFKTVVYQNTPMRNLKDVPQNVIRSIGLLAGTLKDQSYDSHQANSYIIRLLAQVLESQDLVWKDNYFTYNNVQYFIHQEVARVYQSDAAMRVGQGKTVTLDSSVNVLGLSAKAYQLFKMLGIKTIRQVKERIPRDIRGYHVFNEANIGEVRTALKIRGFDLDNDKPITLESSIDVLGLIANTRSLLKSNDIRTIKELVEKTPADLLKIKSFGQSRLNEIQKSLKLYGFKLLKESKSVGGIDLNTSNGMQWKVGRDGKGVEMKIDPTMIERIRREGIGSLSPVILRITPVSNVLSLAGL